MKALKILRYALALGFAGFILSVIIAANQGQLPSTLAYFANLPFGDTLGHFLLMGILAFLCNFAWGGKPWVWRSISLPPATVIILIVVTLEELSQVLIPARTPSLLDLCADYGGIFLLGDLGHRCSRLGQEGHKN